MVQSLILNQPDVIYYKNDRWWAEGGLIHWEDKNTGQYGSMTVRDTLVRLQANNQMMGTRTDKGQAAGDPAQLEAWQNYVDGMVELCKKAKSQGRPDVPAEAKQRVDEMKAKYSSKIIVPGFSV